MWMIRPAVYGHVKRSRPLVRLRTVCGHDADLLSALYLADQIRQHRRTPNVVPGDVDGPDLQHLFVDPEMELSALFEAAMLAHVTLPGRRSRSVLPRGRCAGEFRGRRSESIRRDRNSAGGAFRQSGRCRPQLLAARCLAFAPTGAPSACDRSSQFREMAKDRSGSLLDREVEDQPRRHGLARMDAQDRGRACLPPAHRST